MRTTRHSSRPMLYLTSARLRLMEVKRAALLAAIGLLAAAGTQGPLPNAPTSRSARSAPVTATPANLALAICQRRVPGAQHAVVTNVAEVRRVPRGLERAAPTFAENALGTADTAYFCYRYDAVAKTDNMWATTPSGITAHIVGVGEVSRDLGRFSSSTAD